MKKLFVYTWAVDKEGDLDDIDTLDDKWIRIYALDEQNKTVCVHVKGFKPWVYYELDSDINFKSNEIADFINQIKNKLPEEVKSDFYLRKLEKKPLYNGYNKEKKLYIKCSYSYPFLLKNLLWQKSVQSRGKKINLKIHESNASPVLQLCCKQDIPTVGWIQIDDYDDNDEQVTLADEEIVVRSKNIKRLERDWVPKPKIMSFDIEVNSKVISQMPKATRPEDKVFQISCVFRQGDVEKKYLLSLGNPSQNIVGHDVTILSYHNSEYSLIHGWVDLIKKENPHIIAGYNILCFDVPYLYNRVFSQQFGLKRFMKQGFKTDQQDKMTKIKWSSTAFKNQEFEFIDAEGRIYIDLLPLVQRDFKFSNYKLKTISEYFIGETKDPLSVKGIFKCYRLGIEGAEDEQYSLKAQNAMGVVGKYCVQDSVLVLNLIDKLKSWVGLTEMAKTCNVPIFSLYTQGQQIRVFSQVYKYCHDNNIIVERNAYQTKEGESYLGAYVFEPKPGDYEDVVPFDFCLTGDTPITLANGTSKRIDEMKNDLVMGWKDGFKPYPMINGLQVKGEREIVKVYLEDGEILSITPDHKVMLDNGEWCKAGELKGKKVKCGVEAPLDERCEKEHDYSLCGFTEREKILAFARIVGFAITDGSLYSTGKYERKMVEVYLGTKMDAEMFMRDIVLLTGRDVKIRFRNGNVNDGSKVKGGCFYINLPAELSKKIHSLEGIVVGRRSTQDISLPLFVLQPQCPLSVIREFLGGMFGGDGSAPYLTNSNKIGGIRFKWTTTKPVSMKRVMEQLITLIGLFGIETTLNKPTKIKYGENSIIPKDGIQRFDYNFNIPLSKTLDFINKIGFRYCINKSYRSTAVKSYLQLCREVRRQHKEISENTIKNIDNKIPNTLSRKGDISFQKCLDECRKEFLDKEPALSIYSLSSVKDINYQRGEMKRHKDKPRKMSLRYKKEFPNPKEYFTSIGVLDWFSLSSKHVYCIGREDEKLPSFTKKVIDVRDAGIQPVYDIEVDDAHNFISRGVTVSNCSLYPTTIIAYNIDYHTWIKDNDPISDYKCHVFEWEDHQGCEHDPVVKKRIFLTEKIKEMEKEIKKVRERRDSIKTQKKKKEIQEKINEMVEKVKPYRDERSKLVSQNAKIFMCEKRKFRFLKEPKGVIPTILENLLTARKNTRTEMKKIKKDGQAGWETLHDVLDKRQLAYKVSCNSMYGAMGVRKGYLPFMPGAMCTTFMGRQNIAKAAKLLQDEHNGDIVYGD
jgi:DNA polymerase elongation subunit (family B)